MPAEGENLRELAVLLRVAEQIEQSLAKSLDVSSYRVVESLSPLREGEDCFVNGHMEVFFRQGHLSTTCKIAQDIARGAWARHAPVAVATPTAVTGHLEVRQGAAN